MRSSFFCQQVFIPFFASLYFFILFLYCSTYCLLQDCVRECIGAHLPSGLQFPRDSALYVWFPLSLSSVLFPSVSIAASLVILLQCLVLPFFIPLHASLNVSLSSLRWSITPNYPACQVLLPFFIYSQTFFSFPPFSRVIEDFSNNCSFFCLFLKNYKPKLYKS